MSVRAADHPHKLPDLQQLRLRCTDTCTALHQFGDGTFQVELGSGETAQKFGAQARLRIIRLCRMTDT
jgi:hypothetical protein